jgi:hypothetical protein
VKLASFWGASLKETWETNDLQAQTNTKKAILWLLYRLRNSVLQLRMEKICSIYITNEARVSSSGEDRSQCLQDEHSVQAWNRATEGTVQLQKGGERDQLEKAVWAGRQLTGNACKGTLSSWGRRDKIMLNHSANFSANRGYRK